MKLLTPIPCTALVIWLTTALGAPVAVDASYIDAFEQLQAPWHSVGSVTLNGDTIAAPDFSLSFDSGGSFVLRDPLVIGADTIEIGGIADGAGRFRFAPGTEMHRTRLRGLVGSDSLTLAFDRALLLYSARPFGESDRQVLGERPESDAAVTSPAGLSAVQASLLQAIAEPGQRPYLLVAVEWRDRILVYEFDPHRRDEIQLWSFDPATARHEVLVGYTQYIDPAYANINGLARPAGNVESYRIDVDIDSAQVICTAAIDLVVGLTSLAVVPFSLDSAFVLDSGAAAGIPARAVADRAGTRGFVVLERPVSFGDTLHLELYYHGRAMTPDSTHEIAWLTGDWFPSFGQAARFDIVTRAPSGIDVLVSGRQLDQFRKRGKTVAVWRVIPAAPHPALVFGRLVSELVAPENEKSTRFWLSRQFDADLKAMPVGKASIGGPELTPVLALEAANAVKLFIHHYGLYPYDELALVEGELPHGTCLPGMAAVSAGTWNTVDDLARTRLNRGAQIARHWWGVGVAPETEHDAWLVNGLAWYSGLMFVQAVDGNAVFLETLRLWRDRLFTEYELAQVDYNPEVDPLALGRAEVNAYRGDQPGLQDMKAAFVIHMLRNLFIDLESMNEERFLTFTRELYGKYRGKTISTAEFKYLLEQYAGEKLDWFFQLWVYNNQLPTIRFSHQYESQPGGQYTCSGSLLVTGIDHLSKIYIPLELVLGHGQSAFVRFLVDGPDFSFSLPNLAQRPRAVTVNPFESVLAKTEDFRSE